LNNVNGFWVNAAIGKAASLLLVESVTDWVLLSVIDLHSSENG